jgi:hypothetical protein
MTHLDVDQQNFSLTTESYVDYFSSFQMGYIYPMDKNKMKCSIKMSKVQLFEKYV